MTTTESCCPQGHEHGDACDSEGCGCPYHERETRVETRSTIGGKAVTADKEWLELQTEVCALAQSLAAVGLAKQ